eukprot:13885219-Alexandrium_andersonii.AAC.1
MCIRDRLPAQGGEGARLARATPPSLPAGFRRASEATPAPGCLICLRLRGEAPLLTWGQCHLALPQERR